MQAKQKLDSGTNSEDKLDNMDGLMTKTLTIDGSKLDKVDDSTTKTFVSIEQFRSNMTVTTSTRSQQNVASVETDLKVGKSF